MPHIPGRRRAGLAARPLKLTAIVAALVALISAESRAYYLSIDSVLGANVPVAATGTNFTVAPGATQTVAVDLTQVPTDAAQSIAATQFNIRIDTTKFVISNVRLGALTPASTTGFAATVTQYPNTGPPNNTPTPGANGTLIVIVSTGGAATLLPSVATPTTGSLLLFDLTPVNGATGSSNIDIQLNSTPPGATRAVPTLVQRDGDGANILNPAVNPGSIQPTNAFDPGFDGTITIAGVPEPTSLALMAIGVPAALLLRKRLRRKAS